MPRLDIEARRRVLVLKKIRHGGYSVAAIRQRLLEENISVSTVAIYALIKKYERHRIIVDRPRRPVDRKLDKDKLRVMDECLANDDELTARSLLNVLQKKWPEFSVSLTTIKRARKDDLGWIKTRPKYCQLIRAGNQQKLLEWCRQMLAEKETFDNVIFTDESSVQLDHHGRLCFRKVGQQRKLKPKPKHPPKVHVWAGISKRGATPIVIFTGILTSTRYCDILQDGLLPFVAKVFPDGHRFQQDNDPKHASNYTKAYLEEHSVNWWKTSAESPDLNPIENVWGSMKYFLRHQYKPTNTESLQEGIKKFWESMTPEVCRRYINHLHKVIPKVVEVDGAASGY